MHDIALALGGMTVKELKSRMAYSERNDWLRYIERNGPLNPILRNDAAMARLAVSMTGGKMEAFMPWPKVAEEPEGPSFLKMLKTLQVAASANKGKK